MTAAAAWGGAVAWIANLPDSRTQFDIVGWDALEPVLRVPFRMDPNFVTLPQNIKEIPIFVAVTIILSAVVWRVRRLALRQVETEPVEVGIGAHFGEVVMGDIGGEHKLEFSVIVDTVNEASRLEGLTRQLGPIVISDELFAAAGGRAADTGGFRRIAGQKLRGHAEPIDIWVLDGDWPA